MSSSVTAPTLRSQLSRLALPALVAVPLAVALPALDADAATVHRLAPGASLNTLLASVAPGDTVVLADGVHPKQVVTRSFSSAVTVKGASRTGTVVQGLQLLGGASNLVFSDFTVTTSSATAGTSAVKIVQRAHHVVLDRLTIRPLSEGAVAIHNWDGAPSDITIRNSVLDGSRSSGTWNARGVYVGDVTGAPSSGWPSRITVAGNDMSGFWSDGVHVSGSTDMNVTGNRIHALRASEDHNDGVQSVASLRLRIVGNDISSPAPAGSTAIAPDQAIMLGHAKPATAYGKVVDTYVSNNLIHHWRGKGVVLAGTEGTRITSNTIVLSGPASDRYAAPSLTVYGPAGAPQNLGTRVWGNVLDRQWFDTVTSPTVVANCVTRGATALDRSTALHFVDHVGFELPAGSPCIGLAAKAAVADSPAVDRLGRHRDAAPDAGAHEAAGTANLTVQPAPTTSTTQPVTCTTRRSAGGRVTNLCLRG